MSNKLSPHCVSDGRLSRRACSAVKHWLVVIFNAASAMMTVGRIGSWSHSLHPNINSSLTISRVLALIAHARCGKDSSYALNKFRQYNCFKKLIWCYHSFLKQAVHIVPGQKLVVWLVGASRNHRQLDPSLLSA